MARMSSGWMQTLTGKKLDPFNPTPDTVCIEDVAHALSNLCRFGGHCKRFYSVAEHSVRGTEFIIDEYEDLDLAFDFLMHDTSEYAFQDLVRPIKKQLPDYENAEHAMQKFLAGHFGFRYPFVPLVHEIDNRMLVTEAVALLRDGPVENWHQGMLCAPIILEDAELGWSPGRARLEFITLYNQLVEYK